MNQRLTVRRAVARFVVVTLYFGLIYVGFFFGMVHLLDLPRGGVLSFLALMFAIQTLVVGTTIAGQVARTGSDEHEHETTSRFRLAAGIVLGSVLAMSGVVAIQAGWYWTAVGFIAAAGASTWWALAPLVRGRRRR